MSKPTQTKTDFAAFVQSVYDVAYETGAATSKCVALLATVKWSNAKQVEKIGDAFKLGRVASYAKTDRDGAARIVAKAPYNPNTKDSDAKRTIDEHKAWRAAVDGWSHVSRLAGMPNKRTGAARGAKKRGEESTAKSADKVAAPLAAPLPFAKPTEMVLAMPRAETRAEVYQFALNVSTLLLAYQTRNGKAPFGDLKPVFADFVAKVKLITSGVSGLEVKPVAPSQPIAPASKPSFEALKKMAAIDHAKATA